MAKFVTIDENGNILNIEDIDIDGKIILEDEEIIANPRDFRYEKSMAGFVRKDSTVKNLLTVFLQADVITKEQFDTMTSTL